MSNRYWTLRFARWRPERARRPGYTVVVPVPGDLPVFTELALSVIAHQRSPNRIRTVVVPDRPSAEVTAVVDRFRSRWVDGDLVLRGLARPERWWLPHLRDPGRNHAVQIISAVPATVTEHLILHDADLFALSPTLHEHSYRTAVELGAEVLGVSAAWDPWFAEHGMHLAATWEMVVRAQWLRRYPPHRVMAHDAVMFGEEHMFDTTFWGQCRTDPARVVVRPAEDELVHFNYVISTYRRFQRSTGPFTDMRFRLLLIRLFIDVFDSAPVDSAPVDTAPVGTAPTRGYDVPGGDELVSGLNDPSARVTYTRTNRADYGLFRRQLDAILDGPWSDPGRSAAARTTVEAFDAHFGVLVQPRARE